MTLPQRKIARTVSGLLEWYPANARDLPWRRVRDPYAIWVSEIMLQQTQVKTVIPYWTRWMRELPSLRALARAPAHRVLKLWEGLGYYTRARNLQRAARVVLEQHQGRFPEDFDQVLALPGIGRYTAGAICSIAFNQPVPVLDGNVMRVLCRLFGIRSNPREKRTNAQLWELAEALVKEAARTPAPAGSAGPGTNCSFVNQALMELGATICTPRQPQCTRCPLRARCVACREGCAEALPRSAVRAATSFRRFLGCVIEHRGRFLVCQRPLGQVNAHLWEFPAWELPTERSVPRARSEERELNLPKEVQQRLGAHALTPEPLCTVRHSITRYRIQLNAFLVRFPSRSPSAVRASRAPLNNARIQARALTGIPNVQARWLPAAELKELPFTGAHRRVLAALADHLRGRS